MLHVKDKQGYVQPCQMVLLPKSHPHHGVACDINTLLYYHIQGQQHIHLSCSFPKLFLLHGYFIMFCTTLGLYLLEDHGEILGTIQNLSFSKKCDEW